MLLGNNICRKHTSILDINSFRWKYLQNLFHDCIREDSLLKVHPGYMRRILLLVLYRPYSGRRFSHYLRFSHLHVFHIIDVFHFWFTDLHRSTVFTFFFIYRRRKYIVIISLHINILEQIISTKSVLTPSTNSFYLVRLGKLSLERS